MDTEKLTQSLGLLAATTPDECPFISCYLNLNRLRPDVVAEIDELAHRARFGFQGQAVKDFDEAVGQIREYCASRLRPEAEGIALFARAGEEPTFMPMQFKVPFETSFHADSLPCIYPLAEIKDQFHRFVIVIVNSREARIMEINIGEITESILARMPESRERIGREWTRQHYLNHRRENDDRFLKEKIRLLDQLVTGQEHAHILIAGNQRMVTRLKSALPIRLANRLLDTMVCDPRDGVSSIVRDALQVFVEAEQSESLQNVKRLETAILSGGLGVGGFDACRTALEVGQADMLLMMQDYESASRREELTRLAVNTGVEIETVTESDVLESYDGVGCLLRYQLLSPDSHLISA